MLLKASLITQQTPDFYRLMGPLFGSRSIAKEVGINLYDDNDKQWFVLIFLDAIVGCASVRGCVVSDCYVLPDYRNKGILTLLLSEILKATKTGLRATCTGKSVSVFKRCGFYEKKRTKNFIVMELFRG